MVERILNFIGGQLTSPQSGQFLDNFDPATGEVYSQFPDSNAQDVDAAIQAAQKGFEQWSAVPSRDRARILHRVADLIEARSEEFARAESRDVGKPLWLVREVDIPRTVLNFRFFAAKILGQEERAASLDNKYFNYVLRQPAGVAALITPWNLPLYTLTWKLAPCLAMGNAAVCKPSEWAPKTASMLAPLLVEAGVPAGTANFVFGRGEEAGAALVRHSGVRLVSFTGGTETGAKIQAAAAPQFKKISLEMGGKNANIIFDDADLKTALPTTLRSSFLNSGQICLCGSRILVHEKIYNEFMSEFRRLTADLRVGDPQDKDTFMGPLVSREQRDKVAAAVEQARKEQGRITVGGSVPSLPVRLTKGFFYAPTIIEELASTSDIWQREIFGPVVTVMTFKDDQEAVSFANNSSYGLSASLWTKDISRAHRLAAQIKAGTVWINAWSLRDPRVPFGGMKQSGVGREGGDYSLDFYSEIKTVCTAY